MYASRMFHSSGHRPVEDLASRWRSRSARSGMCSVEHVERRPDAASGQAAAEREQPLHQLVRLGPDRVRVHHSCPTRNVWPLSALGSRRDSSQIASATSSGVRPDPLLVDAHEAVPVGEVARAQLALHRGLGDPGIERADRRRSVPSTSTRGRADEVLGARLGGAVGAPVRLRVRCGAARQVDREAAVARKRPRERRAQDVVGAEQVDLDGSPPVVGVARRQRRDRADRSRRRGPAAAARGCREGLEDARRSA